MSPVAMDPEAARQLSRRWWVLLLSGLVSVVAGMIILSVNWTLGDLAFVVSVFFVVNGALRVAAATASQAARRGWILAAGVAEVFVGIAFMAWPGPSLLTLAIFIGAWVFVHGVFNLSGGIANRHVSKYWWWFAIIGAIEVALGIVLLDRPNLSLALAIAVAGVWALIIGVLEIIVAFEVRNLPATIEKLGH
jgi:uncharacterized membrane protein HdeD (DUF308 family)